MKIKLLTAAMILAFFIGVVVRAQEAKPTPTPQIGFKQQVFTPSSSEDAKQKEEYVKSTKEYRDSLQQLLILYQKRVQWAEEHLVQMRKSFAIGFLDKGKVDKSEQSVTDAKSKVSETEQQISKADAEIAKALSEINKIRHPCTVAIDKAPLIRDIRLGMAVAEVRALHPSIVNWNGSVVHNALDITMKYAATSSSGDKNLAGIASLYLSFFRGHLWNITAFYEPANAKEIDPIIAPLNMPKEAGSETICRGFGVRLGNLLPSSDQWELSLYSTVIEKEIADLEIAAEVKKNNATCQKSPVIRGVTLGTSIAEFKSLHPHAKVIRNRAEVGETVFRSLGNDDARLQGIGTLWTYFLDGKVYFLVVDYGREIEWKNLDQFVEQFSKTIGLRKEWDMSVDGRILGCRDFTVEAKWSVDHPRVMIMNRSETLKLTKREERSKSPSSFRP